MLVVSPDAVHWQIVSGVYPGNPMQAQARGHWGTGSAYEKFEVLEMTASLGLE